MQALNRLNKQLINKIARKKIWFLFLKINLTPNLLYDKKTIGRFSFFHENQF